MIIEEENENRNLKNRKSQSGKVRSQKSLSVKSRSQPKTPGPPCVVLY